MKILNFITFFLFSNALLEMIADLQSERMDEQRAQLPGLVTRRSGGSASVTNAASGDTTSNNVSISAQSNKSLPAPDDAFLDMLMRCQVNLQLISICDDFCVVLDYMTIVCTIVKI